MGEISCGPRQIWISRMKKSLTTYVSVAAALVLLGGCGKSEPAHQLEAPAPRSEVKIPVTLDEKIAAVNHAHMSDEMKKAEIAKLKGGQ